MSQQGNRFNVIMTAPRLAAPAVALLEGAGCVIHYTAPYPAAPVLAELAARVQADAILARQGQVTDAVMAASPRLRIVARHGVGVDEVDVAAAAARGVLVTNAPGSNSRAVAEHTLALILALVKDLKPFGAAIAEGGWRAGATQARDVAGLRLGLVGCGAIGAMVAQLAAAFGMTVAASDPALREGGLPGIARAASPLALAAQSDVLSVHCPLLPATRGIVGAEVLAAMPAGGFVVNTARGGIVDEAALAAALDSGHLAGAALDVFDAEPPPADHPLRRHPRVLVTPHVAGVTPGSLVAMGVAAAECIVCALQGRPVPQERIVAGAAAPDLHPVGAAAPELRHLGAVAPRARGV
jgi:D-3-phosphoglycerate dehydrogenase / 2-oxoglutarate reductase